MKNKKGFTLIELLAVILILGVIALIAVPTVTDLINESKVGAESSTANQLVVSAETYGALCQLRQDETCITDFTTLTDENFKDTLNVRGDVPTLAEIETFELVNGKVNLTYTKDNITCTVVSSSQASCIMS